MFKTHRHRLATKVTDRRSRRIRRTLTLEGLEERVVLSATIYTVDLTTDNGPTSAGSGSGTSGDLRYVINQADADTNSAGTIIQFDSTVFATSQTITLSSTLGTLDLTQTAGPMEIDGPTAGVTISGGHAVEVFQVASGVTASLSRLTITEGSTAGAGGGLFNQGTLTLTDCTIFGNSGANAGGGLFNQGALTLTDCTISGNSGAIGGGGLANQGTATLTGCTISSNSAGDAGGGLFNLIESGVTLTDCTVSGNSAGGGEGGLYNGGTATLTGCTVSGNSAANFGGLYNVGVGSGTVTLTDTIVAGNTDNGGAGDITGGGAGNVTGTYNLIGTGGSGGITNGSGGNIVLTSLADLDLAPLGNYGGPTQTLALLPGSVAIGAGSGVGGITTDQRGATRATSGAVDIGAFQDQGYTLAVASGSDQSTLVNQAFADPLVAVLTEDFAHSPLPGVTISFDPPSSGADATLSAGSAVTDASGQASVTATANATAGAYTVTACACGVGSSASFDLTNQIQPSFSGLTDQEITYGTTSVTFSGTLGAGLQVPVGETVTVTLDGVGQSATIASDGSFSTTFSTASLHASLTAYTVSYDYATDGVYLAASDSSQLTVDPASISYTIGDDSHAYGSTADLAADLGATFATGINGEDLSIAYASTGNTATAHVNTYSITGTVGDGTGLASDYSATLTPGTLTVDPASIGYTIGDDNHAYGSTADLAADLGATFATGINGETLSIAYASAGNTTTAHVNTYTITGTVSDGTGLASDYSVTLTPGTLTVTPKALTATITADNKVYDGTTAAVDHPALTGVINGDIVTLVDSTATFASKNVGTWTVTDSGITITGADADNYTVISMATSTANITPRAITVTAAPNSKTYDGTTAASAVPTITSGSLAAGDTASFTESYGGKNAGTGLTLTPGGIVNDGNGGANYSVTTQTASGTINPAPLIITADNKSMPFGGAVPALTASYTGFVNGETPASLTTPVQPSTSATSDSPAGAYPIIASGASSPDYTISYVDGTLTVASPATPMNPRARSADAFVTTLYNEVLGRNPEPSGFAYWTNRWLGSASPMSIMQGFARSAERLALVSAGRAPTIPLRVAYSDALRASRQAARQTMIAPAGPMALLESSHARASTVGVHPRAHARPRGV
jgi:hypothetical protein